MNSTQQNVAFETRHIEAFEVVTLGQDASRQTLGGQGPIPESFNHSMGLVSPSGVSFYG